MQVNSIFTVRSQETVEKNVFIVEKFLKAIAATLSFFLTVVFVKFAVGLSPEPTDLWVSASSILVAVLTCQMMLGGIFGRRVIVSITLLSTGALVMLWLPMLLYATRSWAVESAMALIIVVIAGMLGAFIGSTIASKLGPCLR